MQADHLRVGLRGLGADREGQPTPIVPNGRELSRCPGVKVGIDGKEIVSFGRQPLPGAGIGDQGRLLGQLLESANRAERSQYA
jgi:hypothetical protein